MKLRAKILLLVLSTNVLLILIMASFGAMKFNNLFVNYLNTNEVRRLALLSDNLSQKFLQLGNWDEYRNNDVMWQNMLQENSYLLRQPMQRTMGEMHDNMMNGRGRLMPPPTNIILADEHKNIVVGRTPPVERTQWIPIEIDNNVVVGFLGVIQRKQPSLDVDRLFVSRVGSSLFAVVVIALFISLTVSVIFSNRLVKPIIRLKSATHDLAAGRYEKPIQVRGHDELAQLATDFNWLAKKLEANQKGRQQWVADISHELRTPLAIAKAEIEGLIDGIRPLTIQAIQSLSEEVNRLSHLVDDLHQLSLSDLGALTYQMELIDLRIWLQDFIQDHMGNISDLHYNLMLPKNSVVIQADTKRLEQLFSNLLSNSLKYTQPPIQLNISLDASAKVTWSDSFPGVSSEELPRLFDRLYRVESSRNRESGGSGLGLAICSNIVAAHQGTISAESSPDQGLTIIIDFPEVRA